MAAYVTAAEVMDAAAVLLNDPSKTDYNYTTLMPILKMALHELSESLVESQSTPTLVTSMPIPCPRGTNAIYPLESPLTPHYPENLVEIQSLNERRMGSNDAFIPMVRLEYMPFSSEAVDRFSHWSWEVQTIRLNPSGCHSDREIEINYLGDLNVNLVPYNEYSTVGGTKSRSYLVYKTSALAAMFIGENPQRAEVLNRQATEAMERLDGINNKGRQNIMTRHRPFRASYKMRGGWW